jgi:phosphoribosylanthranilate isomerase
VNVKICGITRKEDALLASSLGAWALGFIFYSKSPRYVQPDRARAIIDSLSPFVKTVGVFVNATQNQIEDSVRTSGVTMVQLHGDETPEFCEALRFEKIKALQTDSNFKNYKNSLILLDSRTKNLFGGTGQTIDWNKASQVSRQTNILLSGGLTPDNILAAISAVHPFGVDVSSGVESAPGIKDPVKLERFLKLAMKGPS